MENFIFLCSAQCSNSLIFKFAGFPRTNFIDLGRTKGKFTTIFNQNINQFAITFNLSIYDAQNLSQFKNEG